MSEKDEVLRFPIYLLFEGQLLVSAQAYLAQILACTLQFRREVVRFGICPISHDDFLLVHLHEHKDFMDYGC